MTFQETLIIFPRFLYIVYSKILVKVGGKDFNMSISYYCILYMISFDLGKLFMFLIFFLMSWPLKHISKSLNLKKSPN